MSFVPTYVLWNSTSTATIYTIPIVTRDSSPQDPAKYIEHEGLRGKGSIIIPGSTVSAWDLELDFIIQGANHQALIANMDTMMSTIVKNTKYVLKIGRTSITTKDYNVKRLEPIIWGNSRRIKYEKGTIILRVNSWS